MNKRKENENTGSIAKCGAKVCKSNTQVCVSPWDLFKDTSLPFEARSSSPVAGFFFKLFERYGKSVSLLEDYSLVEVAPGWLCVVLDDSLSEPGHKLWTQVWLDGGDLFFRQRSTWRLVTDDSDLRDGSLDYAPVSMFLETDELVDPTVVFPSGSAYLSELVYDGSMGFRQYREAYSKYGLDVADIQDLSIRHVVPGVVTVVKNESVSDFSLAYALLSDSYDNSILEFPIKLLLRQQMVRKGGRYQDGMCYLHMIRPECRLFVQVALGFYPTVKSLKEYSHMFVSHMTNDCVLTDHDMIHVNGPGVVSNLHAVPDHIVVGGHVSVPKCKQVSVATPGTDSSEPFVSAYLQAIATGLKPAVVAHLLHGESVVGSSGQVGGFGLVDCEPGGLTDNLYQQYSLCTSLSKRSLLLLPPGYGVVSRGTCVLSYEYPVCVTLPPGITCCVQVKSEVTRAQVDSCLSPGVAWSSEVDKLYSACEPIKLWCLPLDGVLHDVWERGKFRLDRFSSDMRFASQAAGLFVDCIPGVRKCDPDGFVQLSDPLDDWKSISEVRYEGKIEVLPGVIRIGGVGGCGFSVLLHAFRTTASRGRLKLSSCVELQGDEAAVVVNRYGCGSFAKIRGVNIGDQYSLRESAVADDYCFDNGGLSDDEW